MAVTTLALVAGCATTSVGPGAPLSSAEVGALYQKAQDARKYWLTAYASDDGPVFADAFRLHAGYVGAMDFLSKDDSSAILVNVMGRGRKEVVAIVDTSSKASWTDMDAFHKMDLILLKPPAHAIKPQHVDDHVSGFLCLSPKLKLDVLHMESAIFYMRGAHGSLGPLARGIDTPQPQCVLGWDLLKTFRSIQIDYHERRCIVAATSGYTPTEESLIATVPYDTEAGVVAVEGVLEGKPTTFIIDTAGDFAIAMPDAPALPLRQVSCGDLTFRRVAAVSGYEAGLGEITLPRIGRQLLSKFKVTFDNEGSVIHFERPPPDDDSFLQSLF